MPSNQHLRVDTLGVDLNNYRMMPQANETASLHAMVAMDPERFWALTESLIDDGFIPTENIIVLDITGDGSQQLVKEGNRRTAALKLCHGYLPADDIDIPSAIEQKIAGLTQEWKSANESVPCVVFQPNESDTAKRIVGRIHGKGDKTGRANWNAVAKARHNRDENHESEPGLDMLEKYLVHGRNLTEVQKEIWGGEYPLTVLNEGLTRIAPRIGKASARELAADYPSDVRPNKSALDRILLAIGRGEIGFQQVRQSNFAEAQGIPLAAVASASSGTAGGATASPAGTSGATGSTRSRNQPAYSTRDPRAVKRTLREFQPRGRSREKLVVLLEEIRKLRIADHPHAFCFLLRSMFEISAKAYCADHAAHGGPRATKPNGDDKSLKDVLSDVYKHLTRDPTDSQRKNKMMVRMLHGAHAELSRPSSFLSVTSMNQLIHSSTFSIDETHICTLFNNVFPLLREMNA